jgi:hypothetical protein
LCGLKNQLLSSTAGSRRTCMVQAQLELHHKRASVGAFLEADRGPTHRVRLILVQSCLFMDLW